MKGFQKNNQINKGRIPWNKGKSNHVAIGNQYAKGYKHTDEAKKSMSINRSGDKHWDWKGDEASYSAIHKWLVKNYGFANKCESINCPKLFTIRYEYALLAGFTYIHDRSKFVMLCIPCHRSYDSRDNKLNVRL